jgi:hypothetical protein
MPTKVPKISPARNCLTQVYGESSATVRGKSRQRSIIRLWGRGRYWICQGERTLPHAQWQELE